MGNTEEAILKTQLLDAGAALAINGAAFLTALANMLMYERNELAPVANRNTGAPSQ